MGVLNDILSEVGETVMQKSAQGAAELAAALFSNGNAFVQYGDGQKNPEMERAAEAPAMEAPVVEQPAIESRGMEM